MCSPTNQNALLQILGKKYEIPICMVIGPGPVCEDINPEILKRVDWETIVAGMTPTFQTAVQVNVLRMKVMDLTTRMEVLNKRAERTKA